VSNPATHARQRESAPDRIGPYEVLGRLATGGMAELLLARRVGIEGFQKVVVLKRILPMFAGNPDFVEMFLHEARLAATLEHPNIVQVFDIGKSDDDYYFAMAYLHGRDLLAILRELIRRSERLPMPHAIAIACGIAAGLHHAHEQVGFDGQPLGIVHRDVSPANAIVTYDGSIKLVDFGIAKAAASANVTRVGVRKGKAAYMSPEQCRGDALDRRTDLWSLGVVLYEMLTMARLYRADTDLAIMHRIVSQDVPPPSSLHADIPAALEAIVLRCLSRDRERRYATALELQHALEACAGALGLGPTAGALGVFVRSLFGSPPLPWHSGVLPANPAAPITSSIDLAIDSSPSEATRELASTPPPQLETAIGPPPCAPPQVTLPYPASHSQLATTPSASFDRNPASGASVDALRGSRLPWVVAGVGALLLGGLASWQLQPSAAPPSLAADLPASEPVAPAPLVPATTPAPQPLAAASSPSADELEAWLVAAHQSDPTRALPLPARHLLLDRLAVSSVAARVDAQLQTALDLLQAEQASTPCRIFGAALDRIAGDPATIRPPVFDDALAHARLPDPTRNVAVGSPPDASCDGLDARLAALRGTPELPGPLPLTRKPRRAAPAAGGVAPSARVDPPSERPVVPSAAGKLDDELRPFKK
jgi:serine/threonine protein kinase